MESPENLKRQTVEIAKKVVEKIGDRRASDLSKTDIDHICNEILDQPTKTLQLVYSHTCRYLGCREQNCTLCRTNPKKKCLSAFNDRYYVNDIVTESKCNAPIWIDLVDASTGKIFTEAIPGLLIRLCLLDGKGYDNATYTCKKITQEEIDRLKIEHNKKGGALLKISGTTVDSPEFFTLRVSKGRVELPPLLCTESSEAILRGKCSSFILHASAMVDGWVQNYDICPAASLPFVVTSRRLRKKCKADVPFDTDSIVALKHIGRETITKFRNLRDVMQGSGMEDKIPQNLHHVETVDQVRLLASLASRDASFKDKLKQKLRFRDDVWDEMTNHAMRCIPKDGKMRVWCPSFVGKSSSNVGYLFRCQMGQPDIQSPAGIIKYSVGESDHVVCKMEFIPEGYQSLLQASKSMWEESWKNKGHPGWAIENLETSDFIASRMPYFCFRSSLFTLAVPNKHDEDLYVPRSAFANTGTKVPSIPAQASSLLHDFPSILNESLRMFSGEIESSLARQVSLDQMLRNRSAKAARTSVNHASPYNMSSPKSA